ncbi:Seed biotin-containing protein SBP [Trema orientale]|uniref:Seed biotin-containing protein SBP n=1 Tax=Trema orientale TaxID=63057 RepID=A0A2P5FF15_TREOI|nr:Seed biotin-containing protein SBP [Trema orientale]
MASDQSSRRENTMDEREIHVEKDRVPKMTVHYETLAEQVKGSDTTGDVGGAGKRRESHEFVSLSDKDKQRDSNVEKARNANMVADKEAEAKQQGMEKSGPKTVAKFEVKGGEEKVPSDKARTGEGEAGDRERGTSTTEMGKEQSQEQREKSSESRESQQEQGTDQGNKGEYTLEEISKLRAEAQQKSNEAIRAAEERYSNALQSVKQGIGEKGTQTKDTCLQGAQYLKEKGQAAKDTVLEKGQAAKETVLEKGQAAKDTVIEKAAEAKEAAVSTGEKAKEYTVQKAAQAKDVTVETGKEAAEYTAKTAASVKDKAAVAGWTVAHYSTEKAVEGTKAAARVVKGAAEYAGHKAVEIAAKPLSAAKDMALSAGESAKEYTARKKEEAQKELEVKQRSTEGQETVQSQGEKTEESTEPHEMEMPEERESRKPDQDTTKEAAAASHGFQEHGHKEGAMKGSSHGVLGAIGETIVEIAQTTKDLVIGEDVTQQQKRDQSNESS